MKTGCAAFNFYFAGLLLVAAFGCQTTAESKSNKSKKDASTLRIHLESPIVNTNRALSVQLPRDHPVTLNVEMSPFLVEGNVVSATVVDEPDGFRIRVQLDRKGAWLLENHTASNVGRRLVIFSQFGPDRWLAAPMIQRRVADGVLLFTPDASREEADRFVRGLNNVVLKLRKKDRF